MRIAPLLWSTLLATQTLLAAAPVAAQTLADQIISCGGHGLAMGVLGDILIETEGPSERFDSLIGGGDMLYDGLEYFYAVQSQCAVTFEEATHQFTTAGATLLEETDPVSLSGPERDAVIVLFLERFQRCTTYFGSDFLQEMIDRRFSRPSPCGWRE